MTASTTTARVTTTRATTTPIATPMMIERHRFHLGFRARVLGSFVGLAAGAMFAGLLVQRVVLLDRLDREVDDALEQERGELESLAGPSGIDPQTGQPFGANVRAIFDTFLARNVPQEGEVFVTFVDGAFYVTTPTPLRLDEDSRFADQVASLSFPQWGRLSTEKGPVRYLAVPLQFDGVTRGVFVVANFMQGERDEIESSIRVSAAVGAAILVVATAVAWFVAGRLLRPVRQLTEAAEAISDTDLERRIPVVGNDEIARLTRQFNDMLDRLAAAFAAQRAFVDDAGHELRTPITVVRGHLELMGSDPVERQETVALVTEELDRMSRIVEDLLLLAKAEQPDFIQTAPVEVAEFTTDVTIKARALGDRDWRLDACATGEVMADRQRLTQAMLNLARNAHEHTPPDAEVAIGSAWDNDGIRFWVRDTGPGVDAADRERIFERFARGGSGRRRSDGAGLGLAIVRSVVEAHGGRVLLESQPGEGATFTIVVPGRHPGGAAWPAPSLPHAGLELR
jgi:two-component system OmpR family sensor kinase